MKKTINFTFKIDTDMHKVIKMAALADDRSASNWARRTLIAAAKKEAKSREQASA